MAVSQARISKDVDRAMDKADAKYDHVPSGIAVRNGVVEDDKMDIDEPATNGHTKRKARNSTSKPVNYMADSESDEDDAPLVCLLPLYQAQHSPKRFKRADDLSRPSVKNLPRRLQRPTRSPMTSPLPPKGKQESSLRRLMLRTTEKKSHRVTMR